MNYVADPKVLHAPFQYDDALALFYVLGTSDHAKGILHALVNFPATSIEDISALIAVAAIEVQSRAFGLVTYLMGIEGREGPTDERALRKPYRFQDVVACLSHLSRSEASKKLLHMLVDYVEPTARIEAAIAALSTPEQIKAVGLKRNLSDDAKSELESLPSTTSLSAPATPSHKRKRSQEGSDGRMYGPSVIPEGTPRKTEAARVLQSLGDPRNLSPQAWRSYKGDPSYTRSQILAQGDIVRNKMISAGNAPAAVDPYLVHFHTVETKPKTIIRKPSAFIESLRASVPLHTSTVKPPTPAATSPDSDEEQLLESEYVPQHKRRRGRGKDKVPTKSGTHEVGAQVRGATQAKGGHQQRNISTQGAVDLLAAVGSSSGGAGKVT